MRHVSTSAAPLRARSLLRTSTVTRATPRQAKTRLLDLASTTRLGLETKQDTARAIDACVDELVGDSSGSTTVPSSSLSACWRLIYTTERETLWILKNAGLFGTAAGEVYQVIDLDVGRLQNVITFPPEGAFVVDSELQAAGAQRCDFRFRAAELQLPNGRRLGVPPFGQGWFDTVYCDGDLRVARDSRGDTLIVARDGPPRWF
ncbi:hypothetical protein FOA52_015236 [Chlamydomonas sp. UWO 241]|nr:hypothetical protein FOA52_015236 [Chlamydomonas sp. UWO 241]